MSIKVLTENYLDIHTKADKQFSMIPTIEKIAGNVTGKKVMILGIVEGIIANKISELGAKEVICFEPAKDKVNITKKIIKHDNITVKYLDFFTKKIPEADLVIIPFTINYFTKTEEVTKFIKKIHDSLTKEGKVVGMIDLPERSGKIKVYGSTKKVKGKLEDETPININIYNDQKLVGELITYYYSQQTIKEAILNSGFKKLLWPQAEISQKGINKYGHVFWKDFKENPGLGYFWAQK